MLVKANSEKTFYTVFMQDTDGKVLSKKSIRELDLVVDWTTGGTVETDIYSDEGYILDDTGCVEARIQDTAGTWCVQAQRDLSLEYIGNCASSGEVPVHIRFIYERTFRSVVG